MKTQVWHLQRIVEESDGYIAIAINLKNIQGGHVFGGGGAHIICDFGGKAFIEIEKSTKTHLIGVSTQLSTHINGI
jgi:hypothetical protein